MMKIPKGISRGDVFVANLDLTVGHEIKKTRPVVIVSNNVNNEYAGTVTVVPVTSQKLSKTYPFEVLLPEGMPGLNKTSKAKADQIRTLDKSRLTKKIAALDSDTLGKLDQAMRIHLGL